MACWVTCWRRGGGAGLPTEIVPLLAELAALEDGEELVRRLEGGGASHGVPEELLDSLQVGWGQVLGQVRRYPPQYKNCNKLAISEGEDVLTGVGL